MTNGCVGARLWRAHASDGVRALARAHARLAVCLYVFACLSHDFLWQLLTNRTGASGGLAGVRDGRAWEVAAQRRASTELRRGALCVTAVT